VHGAAAAEGLLLLAEDLRAVKALGQGPLLFKLSEQLLAGVGGSGGDGEAES